jgi:hypothetical protein
MPNKAPATRTFEELFATESKNPLPTSDDDIAAALAAYGAKYAKGATKPRKAERKELLAGLSWLHLNHDDVASALPRISKDQQSILAKALELDFDALGGQSRWPTILGRAICARALPGDTPTKRKPKKNDSSRAEKPGASALAPPSDDDEDVDRMPSPSGAEDSDSPVPSPAPKKKKHKKLSKGSDSASRSSSPEPPPPKKKSKQVKPPAAGSSSPEAASPTAAKTSKHAPSKSASASASLPPMPDDYEDSPASRHLADQLCALPWLPSTVLANGLPAKFRRILYLEGNLNHTMRRDYDRMINDQRHKRDVASRTESIDKPLFPHRVSLAFGYADGLAADGRALANIIKCERMSDFDVVAGSSEARTQRSEFLQTIADLRSSWEECCAAIRSDSLIPGISTDVVVSRIHLMLARRYHCLAKDIAPGPARQEILANTHRQNREIEVYFKRFAADLASRAKELQSHQRPAFVANYFLTLFGPAMDVLLDHNAGLVPGGITASDLPAAGGSGSTGGLTSGGAGASGSQPAARRNILKNPVSVSFGPTTSVPAPDGSPTSAATLPPPVATSPYPAWPPYPTFAFGSPMQHPAYSTPALQAQLPPPAYSPPPPPPHYPPAPTAPGPAAPSSRREPQVKREPLNAKTLQRKADGHPFTFQPQHVWITGTDCATFKGRQVQHPQCSRCGKVPGGAGLHATWDCPLRYWEVHGACPGFLRDGSHDPAQWNGDNLTRAAKLDWARLIRTDDLMLPSCPGAAAPPFEA